MYIIVYNIYVFNRSGGSKLYHGHVCSRPSAFYALSVGWPDRCL